MVTGVVHVRPSFADFASRYPMEPEEPAREEIRVDSDELEAQDNESDSVDQSVRGESIFSSSS